ncbi:HPP family protein [Methanobacterium sp.]|uniref:HPP family protein n=1 Tax=Methanobacterium sp. TaxID=2164 RepID=UPI003C70FAED
MRILDPLKKTGDSVGGWTARIPDSIWAPTMGGFLILIAGIIGLIAGQPWLFPSLGPTAYLQVETPELKSAHLYNTLVGHYVGIAAGLMGIAIFSLWATPPVLVIHQLLPAWVGAAAVAIFLTIIINMFLRSSHPPAAATTLLVSLGTFRTPSQISVLIAGVLIIAIIGEILRRIRIGGSKPDSSKIS